jgi:ArsR family transcriptional regulator
MTTQIKKELENEEAVVACAEQFGLVGDPTRMKICWLLCKHKEMSVGEIADTLGVSVSVVSHSLKRLKQNEMVAVRREHKQAFYTLGNNPFTKIIKRSLKEI